MALLLVYLHGKSGQALSNQMRQTKAMSPDYAIRWWKERDLRPPEIDPVEFMVQRVRWRYAKGVPECAPGARALLGDSAYVLDMLRKKPHARASLLLTSPPYYGVTNYHYDQWIRLWLLGEEPNARRKVGPHRARFENLVRYEALLRSVFLRASPLLRRSATIYVRTGRDRVTADVTTRVLNEVFPWKRMSRRLRPFKGPTQTSLFGDHSIKAGEMDLILRS